MLYWRNTGASTYPSECYKCVVIRYLCYTTNGEAVALCRRESYERQWLFALLISDSSYRLEETGTISDHFGTIPSNTAVYTQCLVLTPPFDNIFRAKKSNSAVSRRIVGHSRTWLYAVSCEAPKTARTFIFFPLLYCIIYNNEFMNYSSDRNWTLCVF